MKTCPFPTTGREAALLALVACARYVTRMLDWSQCPALESVPGKVSGAWVFKGTRTPASVVFENLEDGLTIDEVVEQFGVTRDQVQAVLEFAARSLDPPTR